MIASSTLYFSIKSSSPKVLSWATPKRASFWLGIFQELALGWFQHIKNRDECQEELTYAKSLGRKQRGR